MSLNGFAKPRRFAVSSVAIMTSRSMIAGSMTAGSTSQGSVAFHSTQRIAHAPDRRLRIALWRMLWLGAAAVLLLPAARGHSEWLGWLPLWLLGMPASALWALHRFRLPRLPLPATSARALRRRRGGQARRRPVRGGRRAAARAA